jgi:hypothetical protein
MCGLGLLAVDVVTMAGERPLHPSPQTQTAGSTCDRHAVEKFAALCIGAVRLITAVA